VAAVAVGVIDGSVVRLLLSTVRRNCADTTWATSGKYCSSECGAMEMKPEIDCSYEHAGCKGKTY
jgi:hypothetical protein